MLRMHVGSRVIPRPLICLLVALFIWAPSWGCPAEAGGGDAVRTARDAQDIEPNDYANATNISSGDVVNGSLLMTSPDDEIDCFSVFVPYLKILKATLYKTDYDESNHARIHFNLNVDYTENRTVKSESTNTFDPNGTWMIVYVEVNRSGEWPYLPNTDPGRYRLTVTVEPAVPLSCTGGKISDYLHDIDGPSARIYQLDPAPLLDSLYTVTLECPKTGAFGGSVSTNWDLVPGGWSLNYSEIYDTGQTCYISFLGVGGDYSFTVTALSGFGYYNISLSKYGGPFDNDNSPANATIVRTNDPIGPFYAAKGVDPIDWYKINMVANRTVKNVNLCQVGAVLGTFFLEAFDRDFRLIDGNHSGASTSDLNNLCVSYDGPVYIAVRVFYGDGWYKMTLDLPNDAPILCSPVPDVKMDEDTEDSSIRLSDYFRDNENDTLTYSALGSKYKTRPTVNGTTGQVVLRPEPEWSGQERIRFEARDDGPGRKTAECSVNVTVLPVNDAPRPLKSIPDVVINEERAWTSPDMGTLFCDADDPCSNLTFNCLVTGSEPFPPGAVLPVRYDGGSRTFTVGPAHLLFGKFSLMFNCTDCHPGTAHAMIPFNMTITHVNHEPFVKPGFVQPLRMDVPEDGANSSILLGDLFGDPDLPANYSADELSYTATGQNKFNVQISILGRMTVDSGREEYPPAATYWEMIKVTAKDLAGKTADIDFKVYIQGIDDPPIIQAFQPPEESVSVNQGDKKTFSATVIDPDTDQTRIVYSWYLDGELVANARSSTYTFQPGFSMANRTHNVRVEVSDGTTNTSKIWEITVIDVNRPPTGSVLSPAMFSRFKKGSPVGFQATGSDPDGDLLTFIWRNQAGTEIGRGQNLTTKALPVGTQTIKLEINDGKLSSFSSVDIVIYDPGPPAKSPGFEVAAVLLAVLAMPIIATGRRRT